MSDDFIAVVEEIEKACQSVRCERCENHDRNRKPSEDFFDCLGCPDRNWLPGQVQLQVLGQLPRTLDAAFHVAFRGLCGDRFEIRGQRWIDASQQGNVTIQNPRGKLSFVVGLAKQTLPS